MYLKKVIKNAEYKPHNVRILRALKNYSDVVKSATIHELQEASPRWIPTWLCPGPIRRSFAYTLKWSCYAPV